MDIQPFALEEASIDALPRILGLESPAFATVEIVPNRRVGETWNLDVVAWSKRRQPLHVSGSL